MSSGDVPSGQPDGMKVYLAGPATGDACERARRFRPAVDALVSCGHRVVAPGWSHGEADTVEGLLSVVDDDMTALLAADVVVTLPGGCDLWEVPVARSLGTPVVAFVDLSLGVAAA